MPRYETNLGTVRRFRHFTQAEVSKATGIPLPTLRKWEQGQNSPSAEALMRLASFYGVDVDTLLKPGHDMPSKQADCQPLRQALSPAEEHLLSLFRGLNAEGRALVMQLAETTATSGMYRRLPGGSPDVRAAI